MDSDQKFRYCGFCDRRSTQVKTLVHGPNGVLICNVCADVFPHMLQRLQQTASSPKTLCSFCGQDQYTVGVSHRICLSCVEKVQATIAAPRKTLLACSFCGFTQDKVAYLIAGPPGKSLCDRCAISLPKAIEYRAGLDSSDGTVRCGFCQSMQLASKVTATPEKICVECLSVAAEAVSDRKTIDQCTASIRTSAQDHESYYLRAMAYLRSDDLPKALSDLNAAIELIETDHKYYFARGNVCGLLNDRERAVEDYARAIELFPENALYFTDRAFELIQLKRYKEALIDCEKAIELEPDNAVAHNNRSRSLAELYLYEEALVAIDMAISLDSKHPVFYYNRAIARRALNLIEPALSDLMISLELDPKLKRAYTLRAEIFESQGRLDHSAADLAAAKQDL